MLTQARRRAAAQAVTVPFACRCGHTAGTQAAFQTHLRRTGGGPAHAVASPAAAVTPRALRQAAVGPPASGKRKRSPEGLELTQAGARSGARRTRADAALEASPEASALKRLPFMEEDEDGPGAIQQNDIARDIHGAEQPRKLLRSSRKKARHDS